MSIKIFISYRRDDSAAAAGRLNDRLEQEFGRDSLFMDVDAIPLGVDFVEVLGAEVAKCDVPLAIMGPHWLDARDDEGNRRLESEQDFVRIEIAAALKRGISVIPILLEGTRVPKGERLPDDIKGLARRNGLDVRHASFRSDIDKLVRALRGTRAPQPAQPAANSRQDQLRAEGRIKVDASLSHGAPDGWFKPGAGKFEWFKDHELGSEMVVVSAGEFTMGSNASEIAALKKEYSLDWYDCERPQHTVRITAPFAVGRFAVTFDEWDACVADGGCKGYRPSDQGWGRGKRPVINVSWDDATAYTAWLSRKTGKTYRLLSEAEREYVTRGGTTTVFWWGDTISATQANYDGNYTFGRGAKGEYREKTVPVDSFEPNPWGLYNVHGNVFEWCEDVWHGNYDGAPTDGSAWLQGGDAGRRVVRGGSWNFAPRGLRAASRFEVTSDDRDSVLGFRVGRTLSARADAITVVPGEHKSEQNSASDLSKTVGYLAMAALGAVVSWLTAGQSAALGPALTALLSVFGGISALAISLIYGRYFGILGAGGAPEGSSEREAYVRLRASLAKGGIAGRLYVGRLTRFIGAVDRFFGDAGMASRSLFPKAFGLKKPAPLWTPRAFDRCLFLALVYPIATIFIIWALSGHAGLAESALGLEAGVSVWSRSLIVACIAFQGFIIWRLFRREWQKSMVWDYAAAARYTRAAASIDAAIVLGAVAGAATLAFLFGSAGAGALAFGVAVVAAVASAGRIAGAVAVAVAIPAVFGLAFGLALPKVPSP
jgi:formylglycine-generating enzyme required for sulfatase activity